MTTVAGLTLPELTVYDPPVAGEGSLDPMGIAAISDRLADRLVPGMRARMQRVQLVSAIAVCAMATETLVDESAVDGMSTPAICFEWIVVEGIVRRLSPQQVPSGVPGSQKARGVVNRRQRLSAATYLKGPSVFGFNGVYKPFTVDAGVVDSGLEPGTRCDELVRAWEQEQGFVGFADATPGTEGRRLRISIRDQVRAALKDGRCTTSPGSPVFGQLARSLHPEHAGPDERGVLRSLVVDGRHETRNQLASHLAGVDEDLSEAELLQVVRRSCSTVLGGIIDAVVAYERLAALIDAAFYTLCAVSHAMGTQPLAPRHVAEHQMITHCARELPGQYRLAAERLAGMGFEGGLEERLGNFAISRSPEGLAELLLEHHEHVQAMKAPHGKRPWFEPLRDGWVVRAPYGTAHQPQLGEGFVHPVRVAALRRFLWDTTA